MDFCSDYSREAGEQLFGTARPADLWLLIEHRGRWERDALDSLPPVAQKAVEGLQARHPKMRLALIRQNGRKDGALRGFLALSSEARPRLYGFSFEKHEDLGGVDFTGVMAQEPEARNLFLVCTHGVHDRCCAKFGNALYQEMERSAADDAWQVSHIGGCRFAPNVVVLPHGLVQGRVAESDCAELVEEGREGRAIPRLLRGRSCYDKPVQAAEYFLRAELGETGEFRLDSVELRGQDWKVAFRNGKEQLTVWMSREETGIFTYKSCSAADRSPRASFRLMETEARGRLKATCQHAMEINQDTAV
jgi:hypothetical protein